ncbi:restriction endonuclease subunit S [Ralstonia pickettii]|uniref:restriction endonuclease subunit S n=1 Tax=Ralstonia pickettii TaxID=329 RepID=UPI000569F60A|nr:restriction endonuclease subunit S [Ralstonia pickettii]
MELRPGYKQTEVGVIPEDWDVSPLGRLVTSVEYGSSAKSSTKGSMPVLRMGNLQGGKIDWSDLVYTSDESEIAKYALRPGDVLFNRTNTIDLVGKTSIYRGEQPAIFAGYLIRINAKKEFLDSRFLNYTLNTELAKKYSSKVLSVAVGQANINGQKLKTYPIPLPPTTAEQSAIAEALSDVDALLSGLDKLIAKKRNLKQAAMQQLLTGKTRLPGFAGAWEVTKIGRFTDCTAGGTPSTLIAGYWGGNIRWMNSGELNLRRVYEVEGRITTAGLNNSSTKLIPSGCVLIGLAGQGRTRGTVAMNYVELCTNQSIAAIFPNPSFSSEYLYQNLDSRYEELRELSSGGGGRGGLNLTLIKGLEIPFPSVEEQTAIAEVLSDMDAELAALEARREKTRLLKQGMMQELLTGKTRLV